MEKINISELLKYCPTGYPLDCTMYEDVYFDFVDELNIIHCYIQYETHKTSITFNQHGTPHNDIKSKCVIFPKGKTTWKEFHRPFEDGDIIYTKHKLGTEFVSIFQIEYKRDICTYWDINLSTNKLIGSLHDGNAFKVFIEKDKVKEQRFATEEEKQKLFKAFKDNNYHWNTKAKILEKLIQPKFKVGDKITNGKTSITIGHIDDEYYYEIGRNVANRLFIKNQDDWELVPDKFDISTLKPFESRVLVRDSNNGIWRASFWGYLHSGLDYKYDTIRGIYKQCIPYEGNEHLLGKTEECKDFYKNW